MSRSNIIKLVFILSVSMNLAAMGAVGFHWLGGCSGCGEHRPSAHERVSLDLSPEQEAQFQQLRSEFHGFRDTCHQRMTELREELVTELLSDSPNQERIDGLLGQMGTQQAQLQRRVVQHLLAEKAVLRPEQRPAFERVLRRHVLGTSTGAQGCLGSETSSHDCRGSETNGAH